MSDQYAAYVESADDCYNIGVMDTGGEHGRTIVSMENSVSKFAVSGKRPYYVTDSNLYSCGLDGEDSVLLVENVKTFVLGSPGNDSPLTACRRRCIKRISSFMKARSSRICVLRAFNFILEALCILFEIKKLAPVSRRDDLPETRWTMGKTGMIK